MEMEKENKNGNRHEVDILISTYNGGAYLAELLSSLLAQSFTDWRLVARDDGSSDDTVEILKGFAKAHPERVLIIKDTKKRLGPCQSFAHLLEKSKAEYSMFCDQDDVWLPEKIEVTLKAMKGLEERYKGFPLLVHTDMKVVDKGLKIIAKSFWRFQHLAPAMKRFNNLLVFNNVTGCTMMINAKLREMALPLPRPAILHDWWLAIVASAFGRIEYVKTPTVLYRQHGANETGAVKYSLNYFVSRLKDLDKTSGLLKRIVSQAKAFADRYYDTLSDDKLDVVRCFSTILEKGRRDRARTILRLDLKGYGTLRNLGLFSMWLFMKRQPVKKHGR